MITCGIVLLLSKNNLDKVTVGLMENTRIKKALTLTYTFKKVNIISLSCLNSPLKKYYMT